MINSCYFLYLYVILIILNGANTYDDDMTWGELLLKDLEDGPKFGIQNTSVRFISRFSDGRHPDYLCIELHRSYVWQPLVLSPIPAGICTGNIKCGMKTTGSYRATLNVSVPEGSQCTDRYSEDQKFGCYNEKCILFEKLVP